MYFSYLNGRLLSVNVSVLSLDGFGSLRMWGVSALDGEFGWPFFCHNLIPYSPWC